MDAIDYLLVSCYFSTLKDYQLISSWFEWVWSWGDVPKSNNSWCVTIMSVMAMLHKYLVLFVTNCQLWADDPCPPHTTRATRVRAPSPHVASHPPTISHFLRWRGRLGHNGLMSTVHRRNTSSISARDHCRGISASKVRTIIAFTNLKHFLLHYAVNCDQEALRCVGCSVRRWVSSDLRWAPGPMGEGREW